MTKWGSAQEVTGKGYRLVQFIGVCKTFPEDYKGFYNENSDPKNIACNELVKDWKKQRGAYKDFPVYTPWLDPWGRPYQIRFDLERGKLQVRSQGRYLWTELDDIVGETFFNGKSYKAQVEYCKTVSKDDMSCIFNRDWH